MQLTQEQIEQFDRDGYLFFPSLFTMEEVRGLIDEVPRLYAQHRPENVREKGSDAVLCIASKVRTYEPTSRRNELVRTMAHWSGSARQHADDAGVLIA